VSSLHRERKKQGESYLNGCKGQRQVMSNGVKLCSYSIYK